MLKVSAVSWFQFKPDENKALPQGIEAREECAAHAGDFLMSRANTAELVGRSVIVGSEPEKLLLSDKLVRCRFSEFTEQQYVNLYNRTASARSHYIANASGTSDSMKNISRGVILSMPVPLPPLVEQKRIVARVDQLMALINELEAKQTRKREVGARFTKASLEALTTADGPEEFDAAWKRVVANWDLVLERAEVVAQIRRVVVSLAVRGLLTERLPADDDVGALLADIRGGRERLRGSHKEDSTNSLGPASDDAPFPTHPSWRWVRLHELGIFIGGGTPSKANAAFWRGPIPWVSPKDMKRPYIDDAEDHISQAAVQGSAAKIIPARSLLFVVRGMILAHSFPVAVTTREVTVNQDMKALVFAKPEIADFLLLVGQDARDRVLRRVERSSHGTCRLDVTVAEQLVVPLPSLAEQRRIVAKVGQLMKLCDELETKCRRAEESASKLVQAVVQELTA